MKISINAFGLAQEITIGTLEGTVSITTEHNYLIIGYAGFLLSVANRKCREMNRFNLHNEVCIKETDEMKPYIDELKAYGIIAVNSGNYDLHPMLRRSIMMLWQWKNRATTQAPGPYQGEIINPS